MAKKARSKKSNGRERLNDSPASQTEGAAEPYKVGPGRPPREHQFKKGESGNPKGAKRKEPPIGPDLKAVLERALGKKVTIKQGDLARTVTMAAAGIEQLVSQYAKGDHRARRDLIDMAEKLGVDLTVGERKTVEAALVPNHQAILDTYVERQYDKVAPRPPVLAPAELLDDDTEDQNRK